MSDPDSVSSSPKYRNYPTNAADIDLVAAGGTLCRYVRCENAGSLSVLAADGTTVLLPFKAGERQDIQAAKILTAGSTAALNITVFW